MAKILIVPDVHGTHEWEVAKDKVSQVDYVVFMGDYFDSWENKWDDQGNNFNDICKFKRDNSDKVILLLGNHDWSYMSGTLEGENCSGHQYDKVDIIRSLLYGNRDIIDLAFECDGWTFSHAGFSRNWVDIYMKSCLHKILDEYPIKISDVNFESKFEFDKFIKSMDTPIKVWNEDEFSVSLLNKLWHEKINHPFDDEFCELLDWHGIFSPSGDEVSQGMLWIRPPSLMNDSYYPKQIVGHTELNESFFENGGYLCIERNGNDFVFTDSPSHKVRNVFNTKNYKGEKCL